MKKSRKKLILIGLAFILIIIVMLKYGNLTEEDLDSQLLWEDLDEGLKDEISDEELEDIFDEELLDLIEDT
jgi:hypothetical protein